ncbi:MAG: hypothetical protein IKG56_05055 [Clostridia bacterium]|nr:hypothetical protein [Clostridia bacterium]
MDKTYTFTQFSEDLDNGYKVLYDYVRNRYVVYKVNDNCYMCELVEQKSRNPVPAKSMVTLKAIKQMFPYMKDIEYKQEV